jgi:hypothetical protein
MLQLTHSRPMQQMKMPAPWPSPSQLAWRCWCSWCRCRGCTCQLGLHRCQVLLYAGGIGAQISLANPGRRPDVHHHVVAGLPHPAGQ